MALMTWLGADELQPYPWSAVPCPVCGETELATAFMRRQVDFVCMNCGTVTTIELWGRDHMPDTTGEDSYPVTL